MPASGVFFQFVNVWGCRLALMANAGCVGDKTAGVRRRRVFVD